MGIGTVAVDIPAPTWERFVKITGKQKQPAQEVLVWLVQSYTQSNELVGIGFYGQLTRRYLQGTLPRTGSINALRLSAETVSAIQATYGTSDAVELIEQVRDRR